MNFIDRVLKILAFLQRLPFYFVLFLGVTFVGLCFRLFKCHYFFIGYLRLMMKFFLFLNGIFLKVDKQISQISSGVVFINTKNNYDSNLAYFFLAKEKFIVQPKLFFRNLNAQKKFGISEMLSRYFQFLFGTNAQGVSSILGIFPEEEFTIGNFKAKKFFAEQYLDNEFLGVQSINFKTQKNQKIPFLLMLAIKKNLPIYFIECANTENAVFASFIAPRNIKMKLIGQLPPSNNIQKRVEEFENNLEIILKLAR